jgi:hypothetical protein
MPDAVPTVVTFPTYAECKEFLFGRDYEHIVRHGDIETWDNESAKAVVILDGNSRQFRSNSKVLCRFFSK